MVDGLPDLAKGLLGARDGLHLPDQEMGYSPEKIIRSAKEGCLSSVWKCVSFQGFPSELQAFPSWFFPETLDMFAMHIKNGCPPERVEKLKFQLADVSFTGLMLTLNNPRFIRSGDRLGPVLQAWPSILTWARAHIIENLRNEDRTSADTSPEDNLMRATLFFNGIYNLRRNEELLLVAKDPRLLELAMHVFLRFDPREVPSKLNCINLFQLCIDVRIKHALDDITSAVQGKPEVFLNSIFKLVDSASYNDDLYLGALRKCIRLLLDISTTEPGHVMAVTLKQLCAPFALKALNRLRYLPAAEKTGKHFLEALVGIMALLAEYSDSSTWAVQAVQCGTLEMISPFAVHPLDIIQSISSSLPRYLTNSSVIYACENAVSALSAEQHKQLSASAEAPAWKSFINHFFEKYLFYCYFEIAGYHKGCHRCGRTAGDRNIPDLKRCVACKKVEYCSKDCQTTDWKDHKKDCKTLKDKRHGPLPGWATPLFVRRLAAYDVRRHLPGIKKLVAQRKHGLPLQCLFVTLIYTEYPPKLDVFPTEGTDVVSVLSDEHESSDESCFDDIRLHDGSSGVVYAVAFENEDVAARRYDFYWSPPYFASEHGSHCRERNKRTSFAMSYVDKDKRELETTWSLIDEIAYRAGLSPEMILEGRIGEIRRKVLEVVVREKARMQLIKTQ